MNSFVSEAEIRWSDLDPNFHLRHSVYYDLGAYCRVQFLNMIEVTSAYMQEQRIGPILLREECIFKREIRSGDKVSLDVQLFKSKADFSRWSMEHRIFKNVDTLAAILTIDGAWMDVDKRKLVAPPQKVLDGFNQMPRSERFEWINK